MNEIECRKICNKIAKYLGLYIVEGEKIIYMSDKPNGFVAMLVPSKTPYLKNNMYSTFIENMMSNTLYESNIFLNKIKYLKSSKIEELKIKMDLTGI